MDDGLVNLRAAGYFGTSSEITLSFDGCCKGREELSRRRCLVSWRFWCIHLFLLGGLLLLGRCSCSIGLVQGLKIKMNISQ